MRFHSWQGAGYRVSPDEDQFFTRPLSEPTAFRFRTSYFEVDPHIGAFSIKLILAGEETYFFNRRRVVLQPGQLLLVNEGEEYSSLVSQPSESMSVFFRNGDLYQALRTLTSKHTQLLDDPDSLNNAPEFVQAATRYSTALASRLKSAVSAMDAADDADLRECIDQLLLTALLENLRIAPPQSLSAVRKRATRDELISRVLRARDQIDDSHGNIKNLDDLATTACLSRFHFLRLFSELTGETPGNYARRRRLEQAEKMMLLGSETIEAARAAGYCNVRNFLRAYNKLCGLTRS